MLNANNTYFRNKAELELDNRGVSKAYHAWEQSISNKCDEVEMMYFLWEDEVTDFVDTLRKAGIESFVYTNDSTATLDNLCKIALAGCTMQGVRTIIRWSDEEPTEVMGIRFLLPTKKEDEEEGEEIMNKMQKITAQNVNSLKLGHIWPAQDLCIMEELAYTYYYNDSLLDYLQSCDQSDLIELWDTYCERADEEDWIIIETIDEKDNWALISRSTDTANPDKLIRYFDIYYPDCPLSIIMMMDYILRHRDDLGDKCVEGILASR